MKVAASMSVGRLAPKHSLDIDGIRAISPNVTPSLIKDDVVIIDRLKRPDGSHMTIEEYTDQTFQPYIDQYNAKQRRKDRQIQTGYCEWHRSNGTLSQGKGELAYEAVLQYGTHEDIGGEYYADLNWLLYNAPMEYAGLVLSGETENYLKGPALHGIED